MTIFLPANVYLFIYLFALWEVWIRYNIFPFLLRVTREEMVNLHRWSGCQNIAFVLYILPLSGLTNSQKHAAKHGCGSFGNYRSGEWWGIRAIECTEWTEHHSAASIISNLQRTPCRKTYRYLPSRIHESDLVSETIRPRLCPRFSPGNAATLTAITARNATDSYQIPCNTSQIGFPPRRRDIVAFIANRSRRFAHQRGRVRLGDIIYRRRVVHLARFLDFLQYSPPGCRIVSYCARCDTIGTAKTR